MFQELVSPREGAKGNWYTLPISFLVHTAIIATLVIVPLVATTVLPLPRTTVQYVHNTVMPVVPSPPPSMQPRGAASPSTASQPAAVPVTAPDSIGPETGLVIEHAVVPTQAIEGLVGGLGGARNVVEAPPLVQAQVAPVRPGGDIKPPTRTRYVAPEYPELAKRSRIKGTVIIEAIIGRDGKVENARVLRSSPFLDQAALEAVRAWEYTPTLLNGQPMPVIMTVTVRFDLN
jgi:protein TonB